MGWQLINNDNQFPNSPTPMTLFPKTLWTSSETSFPFLKSSYFYHLSHFIVLLRKRPRPLCPPRIIRNASSSDWSVAPLLDPICKGGWNDTRRKKKSFLFSSGSSSPDTHFPSFSILIISHHTPNLLNSPHILSSKAPR